MPVSPDQRVVIFKSQQAVRKKYVTIIVKFNIPTHILSKTASAHIPAQVAHYTRSGAFIQPRLSPAPHIGDSLLSGTQNDDKMTTTDCLVTCRAFSQLF